MTQIIREEQVWVWVAQESWDSEEYDSSHQEKVIGDSDESQEPVKDPKPARDLIRASIFVEDFQGEKYLFGPRGANSWRVKKNACRDRAFNDSVTTVAHMGHTLRKDGCRSAGAPSEYLYSSSITSTLSEQGS